MQKRKNKTPRFSNKIHEIVHDTYDEWDRHHEDILTFDRMTITYKLPFKGNFKLSLETKETIKDKNIGLQDILTGDEKFDNIMYLASTKAAALFALLNKSVRKKLLMLAEISKKLLITEKKFIIVFLPEGTGTEGLRKKNFSIITALINSFTEETGIRDRLVANIKNDTVREFILKNIQLLYSNYPHDERTVTFLKDLLKNQDLFIQFEAARGLRVEGISHLLTMLEINKRLPYQLINDIVNTFKQYRYKESAPALIELYGRVRDYNLKVEIIKTFEFFRDESLNDFLIFTLTSGNVKIRTAAISALGTCGTGPAVSVLLDFLESPDSLHDRFLIKDVLKKIRSRLSKSKAGWLSLFKPSRREGALSIEGKDKDGHLSFTDKDS